MTTNQITDLNVTLNSHPKKDDNQPHCRSQNEHGTSNHITARYHYHLKIRVIKKAQFITILLRVILINYTFPQYTT